MEKGVRLILLTALISGIAIFVNSYAVKGANPVVYTLLKNTVAVVFLLGLVGIMRSWKEFRKLDSEAWGRLVVVGLIGGAVPFVLFFNGLKMVSAMPAGFVHKTLFIWAAVMAVVFIKEKLSLRYMVSALAIMVGLFLFMIYGKMAMFAWSTGSTLILVATMLWAGENVLSKHVLMTTGLSGKSVALARMGIGALFIIMYLAFTGQAGEILLVSGGTLLWSVVTGSILFLFLATYYTGLKTVPVHQATAILVLGAVVTPVLTLVFKGASFGMAESIGLLLMLAGSAAAIGIENWKSILPTPSRS